MNCTIVRHSLTIEVQFLYDKITKDLKLTLVQGFNPKIISQAEYAKQMHITKAQFQYWLRLYELHGEEGLHEVYTNYTAEFKLDVLNFMAQSGISLMDTAAIFMVPSLQRFINGRSNLK